MGSDNVLPFRRNLDTSTNTDAHSYSESTPYSKMDSIPEEQELEIITDEKCTDMKYNEDMNNQLQTLLSDVKDLKSQNEILKDQNITTRWVIGFIVTLFGIITPLLFNAFSDSVNSKFDSIGTEIKSINQRLDYQEKLNSIQIQRDVTIEVNKQSKK